MVRQDKLTRGVETASGFHQYGKLSISSRLNDIETFVNVPIS